MTPDEDKIKPIAGPYGVGYYASEDGEIWSSRNGRRKQKWLRLKHHLGTNGYLRIGLSHGENPRQQRTFEVHALVCAAFHGPKPAQSMQVRHLNGDRLDNRAENLRWGTPEDGAADAKRNGALTMLGEASPFAKLTEADVYRIRYEDNRPAAVVADELGVSRSAIDRVRSGESWEHSVDPERISVAGGGRWLRKRFSDSQLDEIAKDQGTLAEVARKWGLSMCSVGSIRRQYGQLRPSRVFDIDGESKTLAEWCGGSGTAHYRRAKQRIQSGWCGKCAINNPVRVPCTCS
ncbi:MAG: HNH endonuclease signature motif containing protein [Planctomycetota bacterium]